MSLTEQIKSQLRTAMKEKNETKRNILRVVLGDVSTLEVRAGKTITDDDVAKVVRKVMQGNEETMGYLKPETDKYKILAEENNVLTTLLPKTLSTKDIMTELEPLIGELKNAKNSGQATGTAMKHLKSKGLNVLGEDVKKVIEDIRLSNVTDELAN
jgi:uncharacterized protein YqeY